MGTGFANPVMYVILTPVAGRKQNWASTISKSQIHPFIKKLSGHMSWLKAEIVFEIIDTKIRKLLCILKFMLKASRISGTGVGAGTGIHTKLQSLVMDVVGNRLHAMWEFFRVGN